MDDLAGRIAAFGPFFEFEVHAAATSPVPPWHGMDELLADPLGHVTLVRTRLAAASGREPAAVELRVAASVAHLGLVARLVSPVLAAEALAAEALAGAALVGESLAAGSPDIEPPDIEPPDIEPPDIWWQPEQGGVFPLSLSRNALSSDVLLAQDTARPAGVVSLLEGPVQELSEAFARLRVSPLILRGNVASAVNGAATAITRSAVAQPRVPQPPAGQSVAWRSARRALTIAMSLYEHPALRGAATIAPDGTSFRRRSCCLIYRALPGTLCGDCVLSHP